MHLSQKDRHGKPQRACTPESHEVIRSSEALFATLTTPIGFQDLGDEILELGLCRNCGTTLAQKPNTTKAAMLELAIGGAA